MTLRTHVLMWFIWTVTGLSAAAHAEEADDSLIRGRNPFDPSRYIEYQEFKAVKETENNRAKLRYKFVAVEGVEYVQLQSDKGTILLPAGPDLTHEVLKDARCTQAEPFDEPSTVLTKVEYEIGKRIKVYSGIILATIESSCRKPPEI